jgi:threonine dehydrogenase-like Zn-dependent dehydrogenase
MYSDRHGRDDGCRLSPPRSRRIARKGDVVATAMGGMGRQFHGGYAEYTCVPSNQVQVVRTELAWEILGALPEMLQTAWGSCSRRSVWRRASGC